MMKVIPINRRSIKKGLLIFLGLVLGVAGFWVWHQMAGPLSLTTPTSVTITPQELTPDTVSNDNAHGDSTDAEYMVLEKPWPEKIAGDADFFVEYRLDRERARGRQMEILREVMASPSGDEGSRQRAHQEFLRISDTIAKETELENLLRAQGFQEAAVFLDRQNVTVVLEPELQSTLDNRLDISSLIAKSTGVDINNVAVILRPGLHE